MSAPRRLTGLALATVITLSFGCDSEGARFESNSEDAIFPWPILTSPIPSTSFSRRLTFEDFTGDGHKDAILLSEDHELRIAIQSSLGRFIPGPAHDLESEVGLNPIVLAVVDLPGDSLPDLVVGGSIQVSFLMNMGEGRFVSFASFFDLPAQLGAWGSGDLDEDGRREALVTDANWMVRSLSFTPSGSLVHQTLVSLTPGLAVQPQVLDVDGDGRLELVMTYEGLESPALIFTQSSEGVWSQTNSVYASGSAVFCDLDQDGDQDLINARLGELRWQENQAGSFAAETVLASFITGFGVPSQEPVCGDWDGNGLIDVVSHSTAEVFLQGPGQSFTSRSIPAQEGPATLEDLDRNGTSDLVTVGYEAIHVLLAENSTEPAIDSPEAALRQVHAARLGANAESGFALYRLSDDGMQARVETYRYQGSEIVQRSGQNFAAILQDFLLGVQDFNGDQISDLLVIRPTGELGVHLGLVSSGFAESAVLSIGPTPIFLSRPIGIGDLDGDSDLDLVSAPGNKIFINDGSGAFAMAPGPNFNPLVTFHQPQFQYDIRDYDGDGLTDIVYLAPRSDSPGILSRGLGGAPPTFGPAEPLRPFTTPETFRRWTRFDMDRDGDPDFLETIEGFWLENLGQSLLTGPRLPLPPSFLGAVLHSGDLDGDGQRDELLVFTGSYFETWSLSDPGNLILRHRTTDGPSFYDRQLLDLNADGQDDLLALSIFEIRILLNSGRLNQR